VEQTGQLAALGLEKQSAPPMDLNRYIAERYGSNGNMPGDVKETE